MPRKSCALDADAELSTAEAWRGEDPQASRGQHQRLSAPNVAHNASNPMSAIIPTPHGFFTFHRVRREVRARVPQMTTHLPPAGRDKSTRCTASEHEKQYEEGRAGGLGGNRTQC